MGEQRVERKLAAILAADVVSYSRLMGADEVGTLRALKILRKELIDPAITAHSGRIVKLTGDGILIEFASAVDAVACAIQVQRAMVRRNRETPQDRRIEYRVGINIGDVIVDREDIYGDGVNVAARLEALAEPGGVCISGTVHEHVRDKLPYAFADRGEQTVKNIARPVHVYALGPDAVSALSDMPASLETPRATRRRGLRTVWPVAGIAAALLLAFGVWTAWKPAQEGAGTAARLSMVVLPFANLSGDPAQDYLADVITDELTTSLSRIRGAFVIARSTAFTYKGKAVDLKQVGRDLGVRYVLEGSEQNSGNRVRLNAQLISAETGAHVWADQFDADPADLLKMQDEIVTRLARALDVQMVAIEAAHVARTRPGNLDAEDLAMRCQAGWNSSTYGSAEYDAAYGFCEQALQIDERNVDALSLLAAKYAIRLASGLSSDPQADIRQADELISRALAIEPDNYWAHSAKSLLLMAEKHDEEALAEAERSLALNPSFIRAYSAVCVANFLMGQPEKTIEYADRAIRLSPRDPLLWLFYFEKAGAYSMLQKDAQAIEWNRRALALAPQYPPTQVRLAAELALSGQEAEAREMLGRYLSNKGPRVRTLAQWKVSWESFSDNPTYAAMWERMGEGLRKVGMPEE